MATGPLRTRRGYCDEAADDPMYQPRHIAFPPPPVVPGPQTMFRARIESGPICSNTVMTALPAPLKLVILTTALSCCRPVPGVKRCWSSRGLPGPTDPLMAATTRPAGSRNSIRADESAVGWPTSDSVSEGMSFSLYQNSPDFISVVTVGVVVGVASCA